MTEPEPTASEVKSAQDVLKMTGKDELKFGVLIGLIKVGQVSNKDVVDTVLNLVSFVGFFEIDGQLTPYANSPRFFSRQLAPYT